MKRKTVKSKRATRKKNDDIMGIKGMENMMATTTQAVSNVALGGMAIGLAGAVMGRI